MSSPEFQAYPKTPRLRRDVVITEKIDGTNSAIIIEPAQVGDSVLEGCGCACVSNSYYIVYAQSRKRMITPEQDNFGFARWVSENLDGLAATLGPGLHYGEWWGSGIQRGYGLEKGEKRFSLFNVKRWKDVDLTAVADLGVVPTLAEGVLSDDLVDGSLDLLRNKGSQASPGFMNPEGIIVYHTAANQVFKVLLENDEIPKGLEQ